MSEAGAVRMRPHHVLCVLLFADDETPTPYTQTMRRFTAGLRETQPLVKLGSSFDPVCGPCPHRSGGLCAKRDEVARSDRRCYALCGLDAGAVLPWAGLAEQMAAGILRAGMLLYACEGCEYLQRCEEIRRERFGTI